ncbi:MAG: phosphate transport system regulatory protein PhoU [Gemmatimonadota bacterium]|nr:MAG: phosphate transport system regulatory protein PhoU [Gemmatimonadota bacterium]
MFKSLANFFRGEDWTDTVVARFDEMLELAEMNFTLCAEYLVDKENTEKIRDELYARDREINARERQIRRRIISHLAASPSEHEIPTAFILTTLVKDAERIGDYVKNLFEVLKIDGASFERDIYDPHYDGIRTQVKGLFGTVRRAFRYSDKEAAHSAIATARETMRRCEVEIAKIAKSDLETHDAVALVLAGRHYKRILAHLTNIATSVVMPADQIDYYDEPRKPTS